MVCQHAIKNYVLKKNWACSLAFELSSGHAGFIDVAYIETHDLRDSMMYLPVKTQSINKNHCT